jgi:hypothetical protein
MPSATWGMSGHLDESQIKTLGELRKRVTNELPKKPYLESDETLLRFLRARGFHLNKTFAMLKEDVEWREQFEGYHFIVSRDFRGAFQMHLERCIYLTGKSRDGRPILTVRARHFWPKLVDDPIQVVYFFLFYVDGICKMAEDAGHLTFFGLLDLEGFGYANFSFQLVKIAVGVLQDHFPERLGCIYVLNAPMVFSAIWRMIQPLLDERTRSKIDILGSNWDKLKDHIDPSALEPKYGGTHEEYPVPDVIAQVALDNEKLLLKPEERGSNSAPPSTTTPTASEPNTPTGQSKDNNSAAAGGGGGATVVGKSSSNKVAELERQATRKRRSIRKMLKQLIFNTDRRAMAASLGQDPNLIDDTPNRIAGSNANNNNTSPSTKKTNPSTMVNRILSTTSSRGGADDDELQIEPNDDDDDDYVKLKVAHDKLLGKVMDLDRKLDDFNRKFKTQFYAIVAIIIGIVSWQVIVVYHVQQQQQYQ